MSTGTEYHPLVQEFVHDHRHKKASGTQGGYRHTSQQFINYLGIGDAVTIDDVRESVDADELDIGEYLDWLRDRYPSSTTKTRFYNLSSFLGWLEDNGALSQNPAEDVSISEYIERRDWTKTGEIMRAKEGIIYLSDDEINALLSHLPQPRVRNELLVRLMLQTGIRPSEAVSIRLSDVHRDERRVSILTAKTGKVRDVYYRSSLSLLMNQWIDTDRGSVATASNSNHLFISKNSAPMSSARPNRVVRQAADAAGIQETMFRSADGAKQAKVTAKTLRHTFAVHSVKNGMDVRSLQMLLGHEQIGTTEKYLKFSDKTLRDKSERHAPDV